MKISKRDILRLYDSSKFFSSVYSLNAVQGDLSDLGRITSYNGVGVLVEEEGGDGLSFLEV